MTGVSRSVVVLALSGVMVWAGFMLGPRLAGTTTQETALGDVSFRLTTTMDGGVEGYVPVTNWGVRFDGPPVPFRLRGELRTLDRRAVLQAAEGDRVVLDASEEALRRGALRAVGKNLAWSFLVTLFLLAFLTVSWRNLRPRWAPLVTGLVMFVAFVLAAGLIARNSFDERSLGNPTYFASGTELQRIVEVLETEKVESSYGSEFESIVRSIGAVLAPDSPRANEGRGIYLGSDLHANALVIRPMSRLVDDRPLLMAGDFGQRGTEVEADLLVPRISALGRRVIAVSGNHDSQALMRDLAAAGVTVLDQAGKLNPEGTFEPPAITNVDGLKVAGWSDPFEIGSPRRLMGSTFQDLGDPGAAKDRIVRNMTDWFMSLRRKPNVLMVHQNSLATLFSEALYSAGYKRPLTIATGHNHKQYLSRVGPITIVNAGSSGAGGVFEAGEAAIGLAHLNFSPKGALRSAEMILAEPFSGSAQATRVVVDSLCPEDDRCTVEVPDRVVGS